MSDDQHDRYRSQDEVLARQLEDPEFARRWREEELEERRHDPAFKARLQASLERNLRTLQRMAEGGNTYEIAKPYLDPPRHLGMYRIIDGQWCWWDDDVPEMFGQVWIPVCIWCHRGPLSAGDGLCCGDCAGDFITPTRGELPAWMEDYGVDTQDADEQALKCFRAFRGGQLDAEELQRRLVELVAVNWPRTFYRYHLR